MERSLVIALYLVVCLFQFHTSALQFYLNQRQTIDKYSHIVTTFLSALNRNLIGNLKLVLTPVSAVQELHPQTFTAFQFKRKEVTQFLCLFKASATFKIDKYLFKLRLCKFGTTQFFQLLLVVFLQLPFEIGRQVLLLFNMNILVAHLLKSIYKSVFEGSFTLYWHILFLFIVIMAIAIPPTKITYFHEKTQLFYISHMFFFSKSCSSCLKNIVSIVVLIICLVMQISYKE